MDTECFGYMGSLSAEEVKRSGCDNYKEYRRCKVTSPSPIACAGCPSWKGVKYNRATDNSPPGTRGGETPEQSNKIRRWRKFLDPSLGE